MNRLLVAVLLAYSTTVVVQSETQTARPASPTSQGGDQFLDGVGETGLIARYTFNGNAEDSSRNQLHATVRGQGDVFVEDGSRRVLLLTGDGSYVELPASALSGEDALAVTGWLYLPTRASGPVFDFGPSASMRLFAFVDAQQAFRATAMVDGQVRGETQAKPLVENRWSHFAVVLDPGSRVLTVYIDGTRVSRAADVNAMRAATTCLRSPRHTRAPDTTRPCRRTSSRR